jgi:hypothetical protein
MHKYVLHFLGCDTWSVEDKWHFRKVCFFRFTLGHWRWRQFIPLKHSITSMKTALSLSHSCLCTCHWITNLHVEDMQFHTWLTDRMSILLLDSHMGYQVTVCEELPKAVLNNFAMHLCKLSIPVMGHECVIMSPSMENFQLGILYLFQWITLFRCLPTILQHFSGKWTEK